MRAVVVESGAMTIFATLAVLGFRTKLWIAAAGLAAHGVFDGFHGALITNPGVPAWWPAFCLGFDVTAGAVLFWLSRHRPALAS